MDSVRRNEVLPHFTGDDILELNQMMTGSVSSGSSCKLQLMSLSEWTTIFPESHPEHKIRQCVCLLWQ